MATKRGEIVSTLAQQLSKISKVNGYLTEAGKNVTIWKMTPFSAAELPGITIKDTEKTYFAGVINRDLQRLEIKIDCFVGGSTPILEIRDIESDIMAAIGEDETLGNLAVRTIPKSSTLLVDHEERLFVGIQIALEVDYRTALWGV